MNAKMSRVTGFVLAAALVFSAQIFAQELKPIQLPRPQMDGGKPLMQALKERKSSRNFSSEILPPQVMANLLWAAFGINRPETGHRTAPSAMNQQEIDIYVTLANGLYRYDARANALQPVLAGDIRAVTGQQDFVKDAPLNLVYVADYARMSKAPVEDKLVWAGVGAGCISQNVYLFCASEGLATVVRGSFDKPALAKAMKLRYDQTIILTQTVGYPKK